jgi:Fic family protein
MLVKSSQIHARGNGPARQYLALNPIEDTAEPVDDTQQDSYPALSTDAKRALARVRRPRHQRAPAGYHADFLLEYKPDEAPYLSPSDLERLKAWGETPDLAEAAGTFARELAARLLIDLSWASSRLEGNTYSLLDTERLLQHGQQAQGKDAEETQMILNHKRAIELLVDNAEAIDFNRYTVMSLHASLSENLLADPADEGRLRTREVGIGGSTYLPLAIPQQLEEYFDVLLTTLRRIPEPFEQSFFVMVHLPYLQPFIDVNKRTSRLAANIPFIKRNLIPLSFVDVSRDLYTHALVAIYENTDVTALKDIFLAAYERSSRRYRVVRDAIGEPDPFRQKHRKLIHDTVRAVILNTLRPTPEELIARASAAGLTAAEARQFTALLFAQLEAAREENAGRYGITPTQFRNWRRLRPE